MRNLSQIPLVASSLMILATSLSVAVAESSEHSGLRVVVGDGQEGFVDGTPGRFRKPIRLAATKSGQIVVADIFNHAIRLVSAPGAVETIAGAPDRKGFQDGPASEARFASPHGVAVSTDGLIAVAEAENHTIRLIHPVTGGEAGGSRYSEVTTLAGVAGESGFRDGPAAQAMFASPHSVVWTAAGELLVADIGNARIRRIANGVVTTVAGSGESGSVDGPSLSASFHYPMDIALASDGTLLIADAGSNLVRRWHPERGVDTVQLQGDLQTPHGIAIGGDGVVLIAEMGTSSIVAITPDGALTRVCGTGEPGPGDDQLNRPAAVLVQGEDVWVADLDNHRLVICQLPGEI